MSTRSSRVAPRSLVQRYAMLVCGITLVLLLASGGTEMYFGYRQAREQISVLQATQALAAAREISQYLQSIEFALRDTAKLPWGSAGYGIQERRDEFYRLMQFAPAITDIEVVDATGHERLFVSKREADRVESMRLLDEPALGRVSSTTPVLYGRTFFRDGLAPSLRIAAWNGAGAIVATLDLRLLIDVVARVRAGAHGKAWLVDSRNFLIAHPQATNVLRKADLSDFDAVRYARSASWRDAETVGARDTVDLQGKAVLVTAARIAAPDWLVFVEQPRDEALLPALATLDRTLLLLLLGGCFALAGGVMFARRMAAPILSLRRASASIASGDLMTRIEASGGSEIEDLARDFNGMASKLRDSYAGLEQKVAQRTAELSEARDRVEAQAREVADLNERLLAQVDELAQRRDEAERANAAKSRFLATASHDLRQPMHSIGLLVDILRERLGHAPMAELAAKVQLSVVAMEGMFGSLLDISKLDAGAVQPAFETVDLPQLLAQVERTFLPQAQARGLRLRVHAAALFARSDVALLERIVNNLVANAVRYTGEGGILVACRRRGETCLLQVWDTGTGIASENLALIFDEFFRIDSPVAKGEKGLGLGLSIVQRSAHILGHPLAVRSRPGRGSVFELVLDRVTCGVAIPRDDGPAPGRDLLSGAFVVVADDDEGNRTAIRDVLERWGCLVLGGASGAELIAESARHLRIPDLIVTDLQLSSDQDGFELIECLRRLHEEHIPAVVVTASTEGDLAARAGRADALLLHKPVGTGRLRRALCDAMASRSARDEAAGG